MSLNELAQQQAIAAWRSIILRLDTLEAEERPRFTTVMVNTAIDYTVLVEDGTILVDTSGGVRAITLHTAVGQEGRIHVIKDATGDAAANNMTVTPAGAETIDTTAGAKTLTTNFASIIIQSDGANWFILSEI